VSKNKVKKKPSIKKIIGIKKEITIKKNLLNIQSKCHDNGEIYSDPHIDTKSL
jgi:hypothetical protein